MATGDQNDMLSRIKGLLPRWFGNGATPVLDGILSGPSWALAFLYSLYIYAKAQTRVATGTDGFVDLMGADFFGSRLLRRTGQADTAYRALIMAQAIAPKNTRIALTKVCYDLTGRYPVLREPRQNNDNNTYSGVGGYRVGRGYGSISIPYNMFVDAYRPNDGIHVTTDADIYAAIDRVKPAGTEIWVRINN